MLGEPHARGQHRGAGLRRFVDRDREAARPEHLPDSRLGRIEVVEPVMYVEQIDGAVAQRQGFRVCNNREHLEPIPPSPLPRPLRGAE